MIRSPRRHLRALAYWARDRMFLREARLARRHAQRAANVRTAYPHEAAGWDRSSLRHEIRAFKWGGHLLLTAEQFLREDEMYDLYDQEEEDDE